MAKLNLLSACALSVALLGPVSSFAADLGGGVIRFTGALVERAECQAKITVVRNRPTGELQCPKRVGSVHPMMYGSSTAGLNKVTISTRTVGIDETTGKPLIGYVAMINYR